MTNQELIKEIAGVIKKRIEGIRDTALFSEPDKKLIILEFENTVSDLSDLFEREDRCIKLGNHPVNKFNPSQFKEMCGVK